MANVLNFYTKQSSFLMDLGCHVCFVALECIVAIHLKTNTFACNVICTQATFTNQCFHDDINKVKGNFSIKNLKDVEHMWHLLSTFHCMDMDSNFFGSLPISPWTRITTFRNSSRNYKISTKTSFKHFTHIVSKLGMFGIATKLLVSSNFFLKISILLKKITPHVLPKLQTTIFWLHGTLRIK